MIDLQSFILTYVNQFSYLGVFLLLVIIALIPIPEEIVLLLVGYFAGFGFADIETIILVSVLGVLVGDNLLFFLSRRGAHIIQYLKKKISIQKSNKYEKLMKNHIGKSIFLLRFVIGLRFLGPIFAGSHKVKWVRFFFYNFLAVIIFIPIFILLGYNFHKLLFVVIENVRLFRHVLFIIILILIGFCVYFFIDRKFLRKKLNNKNTKVGSK